MASRRTDALADQARSQERLFRHCYGELIEAIADDESLVTRIAFGCLSCYLHGRLKVVLADGEPPWDGVLVPTGSEHHASSAVRCQRCARTRSSASGSISQPASSRSRTMRVRSRLWRSPTIRASASSPVPSVGAAPPGAREDG